MFPLLLFLLPQPVATSASTAGRSASIGTGSPSGVAILAGSTTLNLVPAGAQLAPYVKASGGFTLTAQAKGCPPSQNADFTGHTRFKVSANPL